MTPASSAEELVQRLAAARIGTTFNQYRAERLAERLTSYLEARADAPVLLVGEAAGYRGARVSGIPFTSERQLTGQPPREGDRDRRPPRARRARRRRRGSPLERRADASRHGDREQGTDAPGGRGRAAVRPRACARPPRARRRPHRRGGARRSLRPPSGA